MRGTIVQVSLNKGGVPKLEVPEAWATRLGLEGDMHRFPKYHGGPDKALLLVSSEDLEELIRSGFPVFPGALGENITTQGIDFRGLRIGMRLRAGAAVLQLTTPRTPCTTLDAYNQAIEAPRIQDEIYDAQVKRGDTTSPRWARAGFYAAVLQEGIVRKKDIIEVLDQAV